MSSILGSFLFLFLQGGNKAHGFLVAGTCRGPQEHRYDDGHNSHRRSCRHDVLLGSYYTPSALGTSSSTCLHSRPIRLEEGEDDAGRVTIQERLGMTDTEIDTTLKHLQTLFNFTTTTTENALGTIDFLQQHLHSDQTSVKAIIKRQPLLLGFQASTLRKKLDWMQETFGWNRKELLKVVSKKPVLLSLSIHDSLQPTLDWFQETLNMTNPKILSKVLKTYPYLLLSNNTDSLAGLAEKAEWLQKRLELETTEEISKVIGKKPEIIGYSMDAMDSRIKWLQKSLDFTDSETAKLFWKDPSLLGKSPEKNLEPTLNWLVHRFGHETAKKVVSRLPSVLGRSIQDSLEPKLEYLQTKFQLDEEGVLNMIGKLPTLFSVSCSNIDNTLQFYTERYGEDKVLQHVIGNPAYLGASLKKRLLPRWEQAVELGFAAEVPIFVLAAHTPKKWAIFVESKTADKVVAAN